MLLPRFSLWQVSVPNVFVSASAGSALLRTCHETEPGRRGWKILGYCQGLRALPALSVPAHLPQDPTSAPGPVASSPQPCPSPGRCWVSGAAPVSPVALLLARVVRWDLAGGPALMDPTQRPEERGGWTMVYPVHVTAFLVILMIILSSWANFQIRLRSGNSAFSSAKMALPCFFFLWATLVCLFGKKKKKPYISSFFTFKESHFVVLYKSVDFLDTHFALGCQTLVW